MDQTKCQKFHNCAQHSKKKVKFIQVNQIQSEKDSNLFYCTDCINEDLNFQAKNYLLIEQIIQQSENSIIQKWPPVNDYSIISKLIKETSKFDQSQHIIQRITNYFTELKDEMIRKIEFHQKKMINQIEDLPFGKSQIIKQYQQISQINQLRTLINECKNDNLYSQQSNQEKFKSFIAEVELKKDQNTQQLQKLLDQSIKQQDIINYELPNMIKEQILSFVDKINFFNQDILNSQNCNNNNNNNNNNIQIESSNQTNFSTKIMQLISNKSNFCSTEFLNKTKQLLEKLNFVLEDIPTQGMFIQGKNPIEFQKLSEEKINQINEYVQHQIQLQSNINYQTQIQQTQFIKDLKKITESKLNFINQIQQKTIINHLIETYPFLNQNRNTSIIQQLDIFELFRQLDQQMINDLSLLIKKKQELGNSMSTNKSQNILNSFKFKQFRKINLDRIFSQFPVFDLIPIKKEICILNDLQLVKGTFNDGDKRISIKKNDLNQYEISINQEQKKGVKNCSDANCMSNLILEKDKKYVFRIQFKSTTTNLNYFQIGLMQQKHLNVKEGYKDYQYTEFKYQNNKLTENNKLNEDNKFSQYLKGKDLKLDIGSAIIELRVWLNGKILQISDYPQNNYILSQTNENLDKLKNLENLSFFLQLYDSTQIYIITEALIVDEFGD